MPPSETELQQQLARMCKELAERIERHRRLQGYFTGECPFPAAIESARVTRAYTMLMSFAQTNYGQLIVKAATSRMQVGGIRSEQTAVDKALWGIWQANRMDAESRLAHDCILTHGRAFALVWPGADEPVITIEGPDTMIVEYREGSRHDRVAGLRHWVDDSGVPHATLYRADGTWKYVGRQDAGLTGAKWEPRLIADEEWPIPNDAQVVPVVELTTNRQLRPGRFGAARGDFEGSTGLLDRINILEFLRLVIAFTAGFPIRAVIGDEILRDDDGKAIAPFKLAADTIAQFENPEAKLQQLQAADLGAFGKAIDHDVETLAGICLTPAYYLRSIPIQNVSADAIRASDAPLNARLEDHKPAIGEGWEEVLRVAGLTRSERVDLSGRAELTWVNRESRSLSERADAAVKLATVMPWQAVAEIAFDATQEEISRWETMRASDAIGDLLRTPPPPAQ